MSRLEKWMVMVTPEQKEWIQATAEETGLKGSDIVREMISRTLKKDAKEFKNSLASIQYKIQFEELQMKREELERKESELRLKMKRPSFA